MKVQIQSVHFDADKKLIQYIQQKLDKLDKFFKRATDAEVILKLNNATPDNKTVEIKLSVPGERLFSKEHGSTFETATDEAVEALRRQLKKFKEKLKPEKKTAL